MCRRILCELCQKPTYAGCGKHVDQVLRGVPHEDRCHCMSHASATMKMIAPAATAYESPR